jgi:hypothetical protein
MDIIQKFLPYVGMHPAKLNRHIEHHAGLTLAKKYASLNDELSKARLGTLGACQVTAKGDLKIESRPGMAELQSRINGLEECTNKLLKIAREYGEVLESVGCTNPLAADQDPMRRLEELSLQVEIAPACWQQFNLLHGGNQKLLPGDLVADKSYLAFEAEKRAQRDKAIEQIEPLREAISKLHTLMDEARAI